MATETSYLNLSKAEITDEILETLTANNNNFELIDSKTQEIDDKIAEIEESTGSAEGIIILEASTDNVIDFNTLTEPGIYLIKNCNGNTTVNSNMSSTTHYYDMLLEVTPIRSAETNELTHLYQQLTYGNYKTNLTRNYSVATNTWYAWDYKVPASNIASGTLATGMACATPTANTHIANKAYVDSVAGSGGGNNSGGGVSVLEASTDNVIDFNTLTESGIYIIKNVSDTLGTTLNSGIANSDYREVALLVQKNDTNLFQIRTIGSTVYNKAYRYSIVSSTTGETTTWSSWTGHRIAASYIAAGTFAGKVLANASAVTTLTNSQVRNIKAQTTDLTAGTSTLATGDIVLVYE